MTATLHTPINHSSEAIGYCTVFCLFCIAYRLASFECSIPSQCFCTINRFQRLSFSLLVPGPFFAVLVILFFYCQCTTLYSMVCWFFFSFSSFFIFFSLTTFFLRRRRVHGSGSLLAQAISLLARACLVVYKSRLFLGGGHSCVSLAVPSSSCPYNERVVWRTYIVVVSKACQCE